MSVSSVSLYESQSRSNGCKDEPVAVNLRQVMCNSNWFGYIKRCSGYFFKFNSALLEYQLEKKGLDALVSNRILRRMMDFNHHFMRFMDLI